MIFTGFFFFCTTKNLFGESLTAKSRVDRSKDGVFHLWTHRSSEAQFRHHVAEFHLGVSYQLQTLLSWEQSQHHHM